MLGTEPQIKETYLKTGQARLVFSAILDHGDRSVQAHNAAECAGEQGQFWPMHDRLYEEQGALFSGDPREVTKQFAAELGLDTEQFNACIDEQRYVSLVQSQDQRRRDLGIRTRPTIDVNGQFLVGPQPFEAFQAVIEPLLAE